MASGGCSFFSATPFLITPLYSPPNTQKTLPAILHSLRSVQHHWNCESVLLWSVILGSIDSGCLKPLLWKGHLSSDFCAPCRSLGSWVSQSVCNCNCLNASDAKIQTNQQRQTSALKACGWAWSVPQLTGRTDLGILQLLNKAIKVSFHLSSWLTTTEDSPIGWSYLLLVIRLLTKSQGAFFHKYPWRVPEIWPVSKVPWKEQGWVFLGSYRKKTKTNLLQFYWPTVVHLLGGQPTWANQWGQGRRAHGLVWAELHSPPPLGRGDIHLLESTRCTWRYGYLETNSIPDGREIVAKGVISVSDIMTVPPDSKLDFSLSKRIHLLSVKNVP